MDVHSVVVTFVAYFAQQPALLKEGTQWRGYGGDGDGGSVGDVSAGISAVTGEEDEDSIGGNAG